jgi:two-component system nitrogen regulation response regulator NtrX
MKLHILIVDDEPRIRHSLKSLLTEEGYETNDEATGELALEALKRTAYDLIFLDLKLPGMNGIDVLKNIRKQAPGSAVIMMSGQSDLETAVEATKLGAHTFLEKPLNAERVLIEVGHINRKLSLEARVQVLEAMIDDSELIGESPVMNLLRETIRKAAPTNGRLLILGENGTGKELVARAVHRLSLRRGGPFVTLNCAAIPENLVESELFGHEKGAFTGADKMKAGRFEIADGGTLFLDEVGDMNPDTQAKLLRVLQENEAVRLGGHVPYRFDVRVIAATNKDLQSEIQAGKFREDLFYRLNVIPVRVPALRERPGDISLLAQHFLHRICQKTGNSPKQWDEECMAVFESYPWPGNVRELMNFTERMVILSHHDTISADEVAEALPEGYEQPIYQPKTSQSILSLREQVEAFEKQILLQGFRDVGGNVSELSRRLKIDRANLHRKLKIYGIK